MNKVVLANKIKKANQRLRQLEKSNMSKSQAYQYIEKKSFDNTKNTFSFTKNGEIKFRTDISKLNGEQLDELVKNVDAFLNAKTSTVSGTKKTYKKSYENTKKYITEKFGDENNDFSYDDYFSFWENLNDEQAKKIYGSRQVVELFSKNIGKLTPKEIADVINKSSEKAKSFLYTKRKIDKTLKNKLKKGRGW